MHFKILIAPVKHRGLPPNPKVDNKLSSRGGTHSALLVSHLLNLKFVTSKRPGQFPDPGLVVLSIVFVEI
jgi:hypothetical protein